MKKKYGFAAYHTPDLCFQYIHIQSNTLLRISSTQKSPAIIISRCPCFFPPLLSAPKRRAQAKLQYASTQSSYPLHPTSPLPSPAFHKTCNSTRFIERGGCRGHANCLCWHCYEPLPPCFARRLWLWVVPGKLKFLTSQRKYERFVSEMWAPYEDAIIADAIPCRWL